MALRARVAFAFCLLSIESQIRRNQFNFHFSFNKFISNINSLSRNLVSQMNHHNHHNHHNDHLSVADQVLDSILDAVVNTSGNDAVPASELPPSTTNQTNQFDLMKSTSSGTLTTTSEAALDSDSEETKLLLTVQQTPSLPGVASSSAVSSASSPMLMGRGMLHPSQIMDTAMISPAVSLKQYPVMQEQAGHKRRRSAVHAQSSLMEGHPSTDGEDSDEYVENRAAAGNKQKRSKMGKSSAAASSSSSSAAHQSRRQNFPPHITNLLKQWIVDHKERPYPTEEEKDVLCEQTGLTKLQLCNWMINARRRVLIRQPRHDHVPEEMKRVPSTHPMHDRHSFAVNEGRLQKTGGRRSPGSGSASTSTGISASASQQKQHGHHHHRMMMNPHSALAEDTAGSMASLMAGGMPLTPSPTALLHDAHSMIHHPMHPMHHAMNPHGGMPFGLTGMGLVPGGASGGKQGDGTDDADLEAASCLLALPGQQ